jgi:transposase-like protein
MPSINDGLEDFNAFLSQLKGELGAWVTRRLEARLEAEVDTWLRRGPHERRQRAGRGGGGAVCGRCGSRRARDFSRNGHRRRQLVTTFGVLTFWLPRVVCGCGGSVQLPFSILRPYQRLWTDVLAQIQRWAEWGISLRQMQDTIGDHLATQVGLRKLNAVVRQVRSPLELTLSSVPPVILLDAIWVTLVEPTATLRPDRCGRQRHATRREKVCVLVALGLYPQSGRWGILGWEVAESESQAAWERLLVPLETRGVYRERGLELIIHDGGSGLIAALDLLYPHIPHQRCLFHKLRNLWQAIRPPAQATPAEVRAFKRTLIRQVSTIFSAASLNEACQLRDAFGQQWHAQQPEVVATLGRDWPESIAFLRVLARFPHWPRKHLRTTSLLERVNRMLRRLFRAAGAFHSSSGLRAAVARALTPLRLS